MVKFPSWLDGTRSKTTLRLPKIKKCPDCGQISIDVAFDKKGNYRCLLCGSIIYKDKSK